MTHTKSEGDERTQAKFAHFGEAKRQQEAEERARAEMADLDAVPPHDE